MLPSYNLFHIKYLGNTHTHIHIVYIQGIKLKLYKIHLKLIFLICELEARKNLYFFLVLFLCVVQRYNRKAGQLHACRARDAAICDRHENVGPWSHVAIASRHEKLPACIFGRVLIRVRTFVRR